MIYLQRTRAALPWAPRGGWSARACATEVGCGVGASVEWRQEVAAALTREGGAVAGKGSEVELWHSRDKRSSPTLRHGGYAPSISLCTQSQGGPSNVYS